MLHPTTEFFWRAVLIGGTISPIYDMEDDWFFLHRLHIIMEKELFSTSGNFLPRNEPMIFWVVKSQISPHESPHPHKGRKGIEAVFK